jgi:hypothetical protein
MTNVRRYAREVGRIIRSAKQLARRYRDITGRPLGITGEVAEYEAALILGLTLSPARQPGHDAVAKRNGKRWRLQIKARCIRDPSKRGGRIPQIKLNKGWDAVLLVLLDANLEPFAMYEASRRVVRGALLRPGSRARNDRGALSVSQFRSIARLVWRKPE